MLEKIGLKSFRDIENNRVIDFITAAGSKHINISAQLGLHICEESLHIWMFRGFR